MSKQRGAKRKFKGRGQAVVEFALVMIFFLLILLAVLDLGRAFLSVVALENAAAEGALYGIANTECARAGDGTGCGDPNNIEYRVKHESPSGLLDPAALEFRVVVSPTLAEDRQPGTQLIVTATYPFHPILPMVTAMGGDTIMLSSTAKQLIP